MSKFYSYLQEKTTLKRVRKKTVPEGLVILINTSFKRGKELTKILAFYKLSNLQNEMKLASVSW